MPIYLTSNISNIADKALTNGFQSFFDWMFDAFSTAVQSAVLGLLKVIMKSFLGNNLTPNLDTWNKMFDSSSAILTGGGNVISQFHLAMIYTGYVGALILFFVGLMVSLINIDNPNPTGIGMRLFRVATAIVLITICKSAVFTTFMNDANYNPGLVVWNYIDKNIAGTADDTVEGKGEVDTSSASTKSNGKKLYTWDEIFGNGKKNSSSAVSHTMNVFDKNAIVWNQNNADKKYKSGVRAQTQSLIEDIPGTITGFYLVKGLLNAVVNTVFYIIVTIELVKLIIELLQRYVWLCVLYEFIPIGCAFFASPMSMNCFISFWRMFFVEFFIVALTKLWVSLAMFLICTNVTSMFNAIFIIAFIRVGMSLENWFKSIGWSTASVGGALADAIRNDFMTGLATATLGAKLAGAGMRVAGAATGDIGAYRFGSLLGGKPHTASKAAEGINSSIFGKNGVNPNSARRNFSNIVREGGGVGRNAALQSMLSNMSEADRRGLAAALTQPGGALHDLNEQLGKSGMHISSIGADGRGLTGTLTNAKGEKVGTFTLGEKSTNGMQAMVGNKMENFGVSSLDMNGIDSFRLQQGSAGNPSGMGEVSFATMAGIDTAAVNNALNTMAADTPGLENATLDNVTATRGVDGGWDFVANKLDDDGIETSAQVPIGHQTEDGTFIPATDAIYSGMNNDAESVMSSVSLGEGQSYVDGSASMDSSGVHFSYKDADGTVHDDGFETYSNSLNMVTDTAYGRQTGATTATEMAQNEFLHEGQINTIMAEADIAGKMAAGEFGQNLTGAQIVQGSATPIDNNTVQFQYKMQTPDGELETHSAKINVSDDSPLRATRDGDFVGLADANNIKDMRMREDGSRDYLTKDNKTFNISNAYGNLSGKGQYMQTSSGIAKVTQATANKSEAMNFSTIQKQAEDNKKYNSGGKKTPFPNGGQENRDSNGGLKTT